MIKEVFFSHATRIAFRAVPSPPMLIIKSGSISFKFFESDSTLNTSYFILFFSTVLKMSSDIFFDRYFLDEIINKFFTRIYYTYLLRSTK